MGKRPRVAIVGSGFSGLAAAIGLKQAGYRDFTVFERAGAVGGVWQHNSYPGAACDVASSLYSFSFEPNPAWSRTFAPQAEIQGYLERCVRQYGLSGHLRFNTEIVAADFDAERGVWRLTTDAGEVHEADVFVPACGQLSRPAIPELPGLDEFAGKIFHSAEWDHDHDLTGQRVAVVGNGASAVQLVPEVAKQAAELTVFQRSAEYLIPKPDFTHPRWVKWLYRSTPAQRLSRGTWWSIGEYVNPALVRDWSRTARHAYLAPLFAATRVQLLLQVRDKELRRKLTPDYSMGCKRILLSSNYFPALSKDHVDVVDDAITEIAPNGVVTADGVKREVDVIIFATGFKSTGFVAPMRVTGVDGQDLNQTWAEGPAAYLGMTVSGFPNLFLMYGPNTNFGGGSIVYILECQARYIVDAVRALDRADASYLDVRPEVYEEFSAEIQGRLAKSVWATGGCTSWYQGKGGRVTNNWAGTMTEYRRRTKRVDPADYTFTTKES